MRSLGLDIGDRRTGVAISDAEGLIAFPLCVIDHKNEEAAIADVMRFAQQYQVERIVVGLPYSLDGSIGGQAEKVTAFTERLRNVIAGEAKQSYFARLDIQMWDERLSSKAAERLMMEAGGGRNRPRSRARKGSETQRLSAKAAVDAVAAAFILQGFLDSVKEMSL
ncbi:MAG: Holliday junction resolvase RuvX [Chloroflexi bacterium]|nr:Holliday junction resolvase RuvX [Chloroflexota bacterium]